MSADVAAAEVDRFGWRQRRSFAAPFGWKWCSWILLTGLFWAAAAGLTLWEARANALAGREALEAASAVLDQDESFAEVDLDGLAATVDDGAESMAEARSALTSPILWPLDVLPVVGRQLASARALAEAGDDVSGHLSLILGSVAEARASAGSIDKVAFLTDLDTNLVALQTSLETNDLGPTEGLLGTLAEGRTAFAEQQVELQVEVDSLSRIVRGLRLFMEDSSYLILGANPAEMRLAGGMPLSVGVLETRDGSPTLHDVKPSNSLFPVVGSEVIDQDIADRWGFLSPSNDYRKLAYSARFADWAGPQALNMWEAQTGERLAGAIQVDPWFLHALLAVTGPVEVDGETFSSENIVEYLVIEQYELFGDLDDTVQDVRRDRLADVAGATVVRLAEGDWDPLVLLDELRVVADGRHILAYSDDAEQQEAWEAMGVDGSLSGVETGVFLLNLTASKLDPFLTVAIDASSQPVAGAPELLQIRYSISITNSATGPLSDWTAGDWEFIGLDESGSYLGRLVGYAPGAASDVHFEGPASLEVFGPDGPVWVIGTRVTVNPGETANMTLTYRLPSDHPDVVVVPSTRYPDQTWSNHGEIYSDTTPFDLKLAGE